MVSDARGGAKSGAAVLPDPAWPGHPRHRAVETGQPGSESRGYRGARESRVRRGAVILAALALVSCGGRSASVPPCNALILLFGAADLVLDCPNSGAIKLLERQP